MSHWLDSRPLHGREQGGSGERLPQGRLMCTLGGSLREKQKIREKKNKRRKKRKKKRPRQSRRSEAALAASACLNNLWASYQISVGRSV